MFKSVICFKDLFNATFNYFVFLLSDSLMSRTYPCVLDSRY